MTWGEFKKWMEEHGVEDADQIGYFDFRETPISPPYRRENQPGAGAYRIYVE